MLERSKLTDLLPCMDILRSIDSAIPIAHFFDDMSDDALMDLLPWLDVLRHVADVRSVLGLRVERR